VNVEERGRLARLRMARDQDVEDLQRKQQRHQGQVEQPIEQIAPQREHHGQPLVEHVDQGRGRPARDAGRHGLEAEQLALEARHRPAPVVVGARMVGPEKRDRDVHAAARFQDAAELAEGGLRLLDVLEHHLAQDPVHGVRAQRQGGQVPHDGDARVALAVQGHEAGGRRPEAGAHVESALASLEAVQEAASLSEVEIREIGQPEDQRRQTPASLDAGLEIEDPVTLRHGRRSVA